MKKIFSVFFSISAIIVCMNLAPHAYASDLAAIGTYEALTRDAMFNNSPLVQEIQEKYGELTLVKESDLYYVTEYYEETQTQDLRMNELGYSIVKVFEEYPAEYIASLENSIDVQTIEPGRVGVKDFGVIRIQLSFSKIPNTTNYHVFSFFQWLKLPVANKVYGKIMGACGLTLSRQLVIDGSSVEGRLGYTQKIGTSTTTQQIDLPISSSSTDGAGGYFELTHAKSGTMENYITALSGQVSCIAMQSNLSDMYASGLACYTDVQECASIDGISVSFPAGISLDTSVGAVETEYNLQDALHLV